MPWMHFWALLAQKCKYISCNVNLKFSQKKEFPLVISFRKRYNFHWPHKPSTISLTNENILGVRSCRPNKRIMKQEHLNKKYPGSIANGSTFFSCNRDILSRWIIKIFWASEVTDQIKKWGKKTATITTWHLQYPSHCRQTRYQILYLTPPEQQFR